VLYIYAAYVILRFKLKGRVLAVTVISPPSGTSSDTFFSKLGRVASSSCGGAWKYIFFVDVDNDGFFIWLTSVEKSDQLPKGKKQIRYPHILFLYQDVDKTFDGCVRSESQIYGFSSTDWAISSLLVLEGVGIDTISSDEHEVII